MYNIKIKPTVAGKSFKVSGEEDTNRIFYILNSGDFPDCFKVAGWTDIPARGEMETLYLYKKTTVWEQIDRKQWIIQ